MIDPYHLEAYGETSVNYNRDIEIFPVVNTMFNRISGSSPYKSPTDMGVNMVGYCITDNDAVCNASKQEIIRRFYNISCAHRQGVAEASEVHKLELIMNELNITPNDRPVVPVALSRAEETGEPGVALELQDGRIVTGKTSDLLGASSALLLNALKEIAGIDHDIPLISPKVIEPVQVLKVKYMGNHNPRLHVDEALIALSVSAAHDPRAQLAIEQIPKLRGKQAHATVILTSGDESMFKKFGVNLTCEPQYQTKKLYHK
jgi:uncharacterized protein (UPF0371 family)